MVPNSIFLFKRMALFIYNLLSLRPMWSGQVLLVELPSKPACVLYRLCVGSECQSTGNPTPCSDAIGLLSLPWEMVTRIASHLPAQCIINVLPQVRASPNRWVFHRCKSQGLCVLHQSATDTDSWVSPHTQLAVVFVTLLLTHNTGPRCCHSYKLGAAMVNRCQSGPIALLLCCHGCRLLGWHSWTWPPTAPNKAGSGLWGWADSHFRLGF